MTVVRLHQKKQMPSAKNNCFYGDGAGDWFLPRSEFCVKTGL